MAGSRMNLLYVADASVACKPEPCFLTRDFEIIGPACDREGTLNLLRDTVPDGALIDLSVPLAAGFDIICAVRARAPRALIVVLTQRSEIEIVDTCLRAGADYVLSKSRNFERAVTVLRERAIRTAAE